MQQVQEKNNVQEAKRARTAPAMLIFSKEKRESVDLELTSNHCHVWQLKSPSASHMSSPQPPPISPPLNLRSPSLLLVPRYFCFSCPVIKAVSLSYPQQQHKRHL